MAKRIVLGGLAGGVVLFVWGAISHMVLPLGEVGIKVMPNEQPVIAAMRENLREPGFYFFPGGGHDMTPEQQQAWAEEYQRGPNGILIYHPTGSEPLSPTQLLTELLANIAAALVVAFLLGQAAGALAGYGAKVLFVALLGLLPGLDVDVSYWNWYGFPGDYTLAVIADHVIGWLVVGLVLAAIITRPAS
ncbi:MAG TPA: hypothetical protein VJ085_10695 [Candidatus Acidoferrales bacterium]|nr:hypothetical protein [Candidatus Acidoferrales bacterium]